MKWFKILYFWYHYTDKNTTRYKEGVADGVLGQRLCSTNTDYGIGYLEGQEIWTEWHKAKEDLRMADMRIAQMHDCANKVIRTVAENL